MPNQRIETEWTLDAKQFMNEAKKLDKAIIDMRKKAHVANIEAKEIANAFDNLRTPLKKINAELNQVGETNNEFMKMNRIVKQLDTEFKDMAKLIRDARDEGRDLSKVLKDASNAIDLSTFGRMESILQGIDDIQIFEESNLQKAKDAVQNIERMLDDLPETITVKLVDDIKDNLAIISNNNANSAFRNDFNNLEKLMKDLINSTDQNFEKLISKMINGPEINIDDKKIESAGKKIEKAGNQIADGIKIKVEGQEIDLDKIEKVVKNVVNKLKNAINEVEKSIDSMVNDAKKIGKEFDELKVSVAKGNIEGYRQDLEKVEKVVNDINKKSDETEDNMAGQKRQITKLNDGLLGFVDNLRNMNNEMDDSDDGFGDKFSDIIDMFKDTKIGRFIDDLIGKFGNLGGTVDDVAGAIGGGGGAGAASGGGGAAAGGAAGGLAGALAAITVVVAVVIVAIKSLMWVFRQLRNVMQIAIQVSQEYEQTIANFAAQTRATQEEIKDFDQSLQDVFRKQGYTDDINEIANALRYVQVTLGLTGDEAEDMAQKIIMMTRITNYDIREIVRAQQRMIKNFDNLDPSQALDILMATYQQTQDLNNDMLDTYSEYSSQMNKIGMSAQYFYAILNAGSQAGVMNLDKVADAFKELYLRISDGNDDVKEAFTTMNLSYEEAMNDLKSGGKTAEIALNTIITSINDVQDEAQKQNIITSLFGAPGEDIGNQFFKMIAEGKVVLENFEGAADDASKVLEQSLVYQFTQLRNIVTDLWDDIGVVLIPAVKEVTEAIAENFDDIKADVDEYLIPSFERLAAVILWALDLEGFDNMADIIGGIIELIAKLISGISTAIMIFRAVYDAIALIVNTIEIFFETFMMGLDTLSLAIFKNTEGFVNNWLHALKNVLKGVANFGIEIINTFAGIGKSIYNTIVNGVLEPIINAYNSTVAKLPGVDELDSPEGYSVENTWNTVDKFEIEPISNDFTDQGFAKTMSDFFDKQGARFKNIANDWDDLKHHWGKLSTDEMNKSIEETINKIDELVEKGRITADEAEKAKNKVNDIFNTTNNNLLGPDDSEDSGDNVLNESETNDMLRRRLQWAEDANNDIIILEEKIAEQRWANKEETEELLEEQFQFYEELKDKYVLTADQTMEMMEKQYAIAQKLRERALTDFKESLDKEVELAKEANNKKIKEHQDAINEIDSQLEAQEKRWEQQDYQDEMSDLNKEIEKYRNASSIEGRQHLEELLSQREQLQTSHNRDIARQKLKDQRELHNEEINKLQQANADIEDKYNEMYNNLTELANDKETALQYIREQYTLETNENIKNSLDNLVTDYEDAYKKINQSMLNMQKAQNLRLKEAYKMQDKAEQLGDKEMAEEAQFRIDNAKKNGATFLTMEELMTPHWKNDDSYKILNNYMQGLNSTPDLTSSLNPNSQNISNYSSAINFYGGITNHNDVDSTKFLQNMQTLTKSRSRSIGVRT